jgi:Sulfotransferase family
MRQDERRLYDTILAHSPELTFIVDSSKNVDWVLAQSAYNPELQSHYIVLYKPIASWLQSVARRRDTLTVDDYCNGYESYLDRLPADRTFAVGYERLLQDPAGGLRTICERCGIDYEPGMERFWTKTHHAVFGNDAARLHLCAQGSAAFDAVAERMRRGYDGEPQAIREHRTLWRPPRPSAPLPWYRRGRRLSRLMRRLQRITLA